MKQIIVCDSHEPSEKTRFLYNGRTYELPDGLVNAIYKHGIQEAQTAEIIRRMNNLILGQDVYEPENFHHHELMHDFCHGHGLTKDQLRDLLPDMIEYYNDNHDCNTDENALWATAIMAILHKKAGN